jgi:hypothetical protein
LVAESQQVNGCGVSVDAIAPQATSATAVSDVLEDEAAVNSCYLNPVEQQRACDFGVLPTAEKGTPGEVLQITERILEPAVGQNR